MESLFIKKEERFTFYEEDGKEINRKTEVRFDPLTGESSRVVVDPGLSLFLPDYKEAAKQTEGKNCPFCSENVYQLTPTFPKEIAANGRISQGKALVFPNLFPYSKHNGVVLFSDDHYVTLENFSTEMIQDAFRAAQTYIQSVLKNEDHTQHHISINWNYLPYSGGSILHPHLHVILSESATNHQNMLTRKARAFKENHQTEYFKFLYEHEKKLGERWIGEHGNIAWLHMFAPRSHNDFLAIFTKSSSICEIDEATWQSFAEGVKGIFATFTEQGFASFNMSLFFSNDETPVHARFIPRLIIGSLGTSDINYFQALHQEPLSYKVPEEVAAIARKHFST